MKEYQPPYVIAEVGCNHMGNMAIAHELIKQAAVCGASAVKFQKRCPRELLTAEQYNAPHPCPENAYGSTYGAHREYLELSLEQHKQLKQWCEEYGLTYSSSVWDMTSAKEIASLNPKYIKIPSACNNNLEMLTWLCVNYSGSIHISVGMTIDAEEKEIIRVHKEYGRLKQLVLYHCVSGYPISCKDSCLLEITRLLEQFGDEVCAIGLSGHHLGTALDIAGYTLRATYIERHFTLNHSWKGTDHAASLEPFELKRLVADLSSVFSALNMKQCELLPVEVAQRDKLKYRSR